MLRDFFLFLCLVLARALRGVSGKAWAGSTLGRGTNGVHNSGLQAHFLRGVTLKWCWFNDAGCVESQLLGRAGVRPQPGYTLTATSTVATACTLQTC